MTSAGFPAFYPIIDDDVCRARGVEPLALAEACLEGGARLLQVRVKAGGSAAILRLVEAVQARAARAGARVVLNDRADLAALAGTGVHVGQADLPAVDARALLGPGAMVGLSTHTPAQVDEALRGPASYIAVGPVFATATKDTGYGARGLDLVRYAAGRDKPVVAIGGITLATAASVLDAGASSVAVIGDLFASADLVSHVRRYVALR